MNSVNNYYTHGYTYCIAGCVFVIICERTGFVLSK